MLHCNLFGISLLISGKVSWSFAASSSASFSDGLCLGTSSALVNGYLGVGTHQQWYLVSCKRTVCVCVAVC